MAESVIFTIVVGVLSVVILYNLGFTYLDPRWIIAVIFLLLIPGFYAAVRSGPFVPSNKERHKKMMKLAKIKSTDLVYDLGCGDGRLIFSAAKKAKKAIGYEFSIPLYLWGRFFQFFNKNSEIRFGNLWQQNYSDADVIFCYLLPKAMKEFYKKIWPHLKKGTRVISNSFQIHDIKPSDQDGKVYLYVKD